MILYEHDGAGISIDDFVEQLAPHIDKGDTLSVELDTMRFGKVSRGLNKEQFLTGVFEIFHRLVGEQGTIIIPTFSYSWGADSAHKYFDVANTPGKVGIFPEYFRNRDDVIRSLDPMFSLAAWGRDKEWLTHNDSKSSFGQGSLYHKMHERNAKAISFGLKKFDPTFVHYVEQRFHETVSELDYRFVKRFEGTIVDRTGAEYEDHQYCFSRVLDKCVGLEFDESLMVHALSGRNQFVTLAVGNAKICLSDYHAIFEVGIEGLRNNRAFFMSCRGKKGCIDTI